MSLIRYQPLSSVSDLQREINRLFEAPWRGDEPNGVLSSDWAPAVDIREEDARFVLYVDVPGINPDQIDITFENGVLTLKGQREHIREEEQNSYKRVERVRGSFMRRFTLPDTVDGEGITARTENGVLQVSVPKGEKAQPRRIEIEH